MSEKFRYVSEEPKSLQVLIWMQSKEIALSFDWQLQCLRKSSYSLIRQVSDEVR